MPDAQSLITCPHCQHEFPLSEAVAQRIRGDLSREFEERRRTAEAALAEREKSVRDHQAQLETQRQHLDEELAKRMVVERQKLLATAAQQEREKIGIEFRDLQGQLAEQRTRLDTARQTELELRKQQRLVEERAQQLELELEQNLRSEFLNDAIDPVAKGVRGADVLQRVRTNAGLECGAILWETKRTKHWAREWPAKLKEDQREARAELAVIVTRTLPDGVKAFALHEGIWVCDYGSAIPLGVALRQGLIQAAVARQAQAGRQGKMEQLYEYLSGHEFKQRIEAIVEAFVTMQGDLDSERRAMERQWAKRVRSIRQVISHTAGLYGGVQGIVGQATLPEINSLELPAGG